MRLISNKCIELYGRWHKENLGMSDYIDNDTNPDQNGFKLKTGNYILCYCNLSLSCV